MRAIGGVQSYSQKHKPIGWAKKANMFKKILIANRGEIACRVAATAARLAIKTVAVYSDADANAKHVAACNASVHIGGSAPKDSYLRWENIIAAALAGQRRQLER